MTSPETKKCPFCAEEILVDAKKCKHCSSILEERPVVIEQTGKSIKKKMLMSGALGAMGLFTLIVGSGSGMPTLSTIGILMIIGGIVGFYGAKISGWWHHG